MQDIYERARGVRIAIFDVDGVLTDGALHLSASGEETKAFDVRDGHGLKMLKASGVPAAIITSRNSRAVELRAQGLAIDFVFQGVADKLATFEGLLRQLKLDAAAAAYMGDDVLDLPVMRRCGLAFTVPEAPLAVRHVAHYVTRAAGGRGAAREACEILMHAQGSLAAQLACCRR